MAAQKIFDSWPERYDQWFATPMGSLVREYEGRVMRELLRPVPGELILDAGCGTGVFTADLLEAGARVAGLEISRPMLARAAAKTRGKAFYPLAGDMLQLPFADERFDKSVSMTTLEFIRDGRRAVQELFRVTRAGGVVVVSTLNSRSPWAERRRTKAREGSRFFQQMIFRSPEELQDLGPGPGELRSAVHFQKDDPPDRARELERKGRRQGLMSGAFLAAAWIKGEERP